MCAGRGEGRGAERGGVVIREGAGRVLGSGEKWRSYSVHRDTPRQSNYKWADPDLNAENVAKVHVFGRVLPGGSTP